MGVQSIVDSSNVPDDVWGCDDSVDLLLLSKLNLILDICREEDFILVFFLFQSNKILRLLINVNRVVEILNHIRECS